MIPQRTSGGILAPPRQSVKSQKKPSKTAASVPLPEGAAKNNHKSFFPKLRVGCYTAAALLAALYHQALFVAYCALALAETAELILERKAQRNGALDAKAKLKKGKE